MSTFNPQKPSVKIIPPATKVQPLIGRKYTLTHSDTTGQLFSSIGYDYDFAAIDQKMRDEVLAEWKRDVRGFFYLAGKVRVDGKDKNKSASKVRFNIFRKEMDTALKGIIYSDQPFFAAYPLLLDAPIYIYFDSIFPEYNQVFYFGTVMKYLT
ncbi:hypothetical protein CIB95_15295 [Lottiidibacillus patelloidae]|uniref:Staygreen protein domain-containing protein n=1 Tax=Lottiidibacillus patelloidae TaxID=2670334 RepID=A0A263BPY1_9BACI|nr:staygreen family protein [Lottiidibacillus patelloidae]OZM55800.1 hypothetical protein CIB95_15295 [Lottiidibacillus patelloidae]